MFDGIETTTIRRPNQAPIGERQDTLTSKLVHGFSLGRAGSVHDMLEARRQEINDMGFSGTFNFFYLPLLV